MMNRLKGKVLGLALLAGALLSAAGIGWADGLRHVHGPGSRHGHVQAHRHVHGGARVGIGIQLGPGFFYPAYPYYPYYTYPYSYPGYYGLGPSYLVPASPPQYIERGDDAGTPAPAYWYRCADPEGYYPHVAACPGGWQRVPAEPPATVR